MNDSNDILARPTKLEKHHWQLRLFCVGVLMLIGVALISGHILLQRLEEALTLLHN